MDLFLRLGRLMNRFRYPVSQPEEVAHDLGVELSNSLSFSEFLDLLSSPSISPTRACKYMPRIAAEKIFEGALRREQFQSISLFSYYFPQGWLVFVLHYDQGARLRRLQLQCPAGVYHLEEFDIPLRNYELPIHLYSHC